MAAKKKGHKIEKETKKDKPKKVDPNKELKKEFMTTFNYFRAMRLMGTVALKELKVAKKQLKEGKTATAERLLKKYGLVNINHFLAYSIEAQETERAERKKSKKKGK